MEAFLGLLAFGTVGFWAAIALYAIICLFYMERFDEDHEADFSMAPVVFLSIVLGAMFYFSGPLKSLFEWASVNKMNMALLFVGYFVVGSFYSMMKFWCFLQKIKDRYLSYRVSWLVRELGDFKGGTNDSYETYAIPDELKGKWTNSLETMERGVVFDFAAGKLRVSRYKSLITSWIVWWPISGIWFIINDPVKRIANWLFEKFKSIYSKIYRAAVGKIWQDLDFTEARKAKACKRVGSEDMDGR